MSNTGKEKPADLRTDNQTSYLLWVTSWKRYKQAKTTMHMNTNEHTTGLAIGKKPVVG